MKNTLKLLVAICFIVFAGCEEKNNEEQHFLVGKWSFTEKIVYDKNGKELVVYEENNYYCPLDYYFFKSDGKLEKADFKSGLDVEQPCLGRLEYSTWLLTESSLKIQSDKFPTENYTIIKVSNNEIQLEQKVPADVFELFEGEAETQKIILKR